MKIDLAGREFCLSESRPLRVTGATGVCVHCTNGTIWITTSNEPDDVFLGTGQSYRIVSGELTLIEGIGDARIRLDYPAPGGIMKGWPEQLARGFSGTRRTAGELLGVKTP